MQERSSSPGLGNIVIFAVILVLALVVYPWVLHRFFPPPPKIAEAPVAEEPKDGKAAKAAGEKAAAEKNNEKKDGKKAADSAAGKKAASEKKPEKEPEKAGDKPTLPGKDDKAKPAAGKDAAGPQKAPPEKKINEPRQYVMLGSVDPDPANPFRMLVTTSNEGASIPRIEFSSERYRDLDDRSGYLGHLVMDDFDRGPGCLVQVVGPGTPAAAAGIKLGDRILKLAYQGQATEIDGPTSLELALRQCKPRDIVSMVIQRGNEKPLTTDVTLIRRPLEVIRPEQRKPSVDWVKNGPMDAINRSENCPLSFLTTLQGVDEKNPNNLPPDVDPDAKWEEELSREMPGVNLRTANWHVEPDGAPGKADGPRTKVVFSCPVPEYRLTIFKSYELVKVEGDPAKELDAMAYHLVLTIQAVNNDSKPHQVAYRLDGPNGLPVEGEWYVTSKVGRTWSAEGLRDVIYLLSKSDVAVATAMQLSDKFFKVIGESTEFADHPPRFYGVDAQYFSVVMLPDLQTTALRIERALGLRVGDVAEQRKTLTNTSFRLISKMIPVEPDQRPVTLGSYEIFAGPKRPQLLAKYDLPGEGQNLKVLICYGWPIFQWVAVPMTLVLDFFYGIVHNYGLAIIMLTVVVRLAFWPVSHKQAQSTQLMQKIQPKLKELEKKHKGDWKALQQARQELLAKYNYNPSSGCLLLFLQLPVFIGLYRALQVNVELRGAALLSQSIRWCSNLAAPDMLYDWHGFMPAAVNNGVGYPGIPLIGTMLGMGPYLNLFPIITLMLFLVQQKVMMPPPADEQAAQQQKIMKYVMFLMGFMFFKVAAGLCIYFISTTLWGLAEKKLLPQPKAQDGDSSDEGLPARPAPKPPKPERLSNADREAIRRKKLGGKK